MRVHVKGYHCPPHRVSGHHVSGYTRVIHGRRKRIEGHHRSGHHVVGHRVLGHYRVM